MADVYLQMTVTICLRSLESFLKVKPGELDYSLLAGDLTGFFPNPINTGITPNSDAYLKVREMILTDIPPSYYGRIVSYRLNEGDGQIILKLKIKDLRQ